MGNNDFSHGFRLAHRHGLNDDVWSVIIKGVLAGGGRGLRGHQ